MFDQRMDELDQQIAIIAEENPIAKRLQQLRGVGPLIVRLPWWRRWAMPGSTVKAETWLRRLV